MTDRFYYEYEVEDDEYAIMEDGGGCEHGQYYDVCHFFVIREDDAKDAVKLLNKLYKKAQEK